jgi:uncharacterized protein YeaO (DUF488 family)
MEHACRKGSSPWLGIKRVYDNPAPEDGLRILVDRSGWVV